jgi:threonine/homoserine/homoserine lactone efflux protein
MLLGLAGLLFLLSSSLRAVESVSTAAPATDIIPTPSPTDGILQTGSDPQTAALWVSVAAVIIVLGVTLHHQLRKKY